MKPNQIFRGVATGAVFVVMAMRPASALTIAQDGQSTCSIVVPADAVASAKAAATDLQSCLQASTGVKLPIVASAPASGGAIFVGADAAALAGVTLPADLTGADFLMRCDGNRVVLAGNDAAGNPFDLHWNQDIVTPSFSATSAFLERFVGARWLWPGASGTIMPHHDRLEIADFSSVEKPDFIERNVALDYYGHPETQLWARHNRLGAPLHLQMWHNWYNLFPESKYYATHPEYFALVNGKRGVGDGATGAVYGHQLCTSNPDVRRIFAENAEAELRKYPNTQCISISSNDGARQCECDACRALDVGKNADGTPMLTDRMFAFFNDVARSVARAMPGKIVGVYAYQDYATYSPRVHVEPNLYVGDVYNSIGNAWWSPKLRDTDLVNIDGWRRSCKQMVMVSYYYQNFLAMMGLPETTPEILATTTRRLKADGGLGWRFNVQTPCLLDKYLESRLLWDSSANVDKLRTQYYELFGPAAGPLVRQADDLLIAQEKAVAMPAEHLAHNPDDVGVDGLGTKIATLTFDPIRAQTSQLLAQAAAAPATPQQKAALQVIEDTWRYTTLTLDALHAVDAVEQQAKLGADARDTKVLLASRQAIEARRAFIADAKTSDPEHVIVASVQPDWDKQFTDYVPFEPVAARITGLLAGHKSVANVKSITDAAPTDGDWAAAPSLTPFIENKLGLVPQAQTAAKLIYGKDALFVHIECAEPGGDAALHDAVTARDGAVWGENAIELFIDPDNAHRRYFHLITNSIGGMFDEVKGGGKSDPSWNGAWTVHTTRTAGGWNADFAIPFAVLGVTAPLPGDVWGFNICRLRPGVSEYSAWSPTFGLFDQPAQFGQIVFR